MSILLSRIIYTLIFKNQPFMKEKSAEGSSEGDRTFDFKYKIDLSDRRGKTG